MRHKIVGKDAGVELDTTISFLRHAGYEAAQEMKKNSKIKDNFVREDNWHRESCRHSGLKTPQRDKNSLVKLSLVPIMEKACPDSDRLEPISSPEWKNIDRLDNNENTDKNKSKKVKKSKCESPTKKSKIGGAAYNYLHEPEALACICNAPSGNNKLRNEEIMNFDDETNYQSFFRGVPIVDKDHSQKDIYKNNSYKRTTICKPFDTELLNSNDRWLSNIPMEYISAKYTYQIQSLTKNSESDFKVMYNKYPYSEGINWVKTNNFKTLSNLTKRSEKGE